MIQECILNNGTFQIIGFRRSQVRHWMSVHDYNHSEDTRYGSLSKKFIHSMASSDVDQFN